MPLIRDDDEERRARIEHMLEEIQKVRDVAARQLEYARRTLEDSELALHRLKTALNDLTTHPKK